jgi:hypothetical protein
MKVSLIKIVLFFKVKIWFQNHRYKTKKQAKEREKLDAKQFRKDHHHHHHHQQQQQYQQQQQFR